MKEIWRPVFGYENRYEMSTRGIVRNPRTGKILKPGKNTGGYLKVVLCKDGLAKNCLVHRLVAMTFPDMVGWTEDAKGRPFEELQINHKDKNKENNRVENLEWCDWKYNNNYGGHNELISKTKSKTVYQCTMDDQLVKVWPSATECDKYGFNHSHIAKCCNGTRKKHKGFKWSYLPPSC